jgi:hypothetical protein
MQRMGDDEMKQLHVDAFNFANEVAQAVDPDHGDDFKTAFVAVMLVEVRRHEIPVAAVLDPVRKVRGRKPGAKKPGRKPNAVPVLASDADAMTSAQAAAYLDVSQKRFENMRTNNKAPAGYRVGNRWMYSRAVLDSFRAKLAA